MEKYRIIKRHIAYLLSLVFWLLVSIFLTPQFCTR